MAPNEQNDGKQKTYEQPETDRSHQPRFDPPTEGKSTDAGDQPQGDTGSDTGTGTTDRQR